MKSPKEKVKEKNKGPKTGNAENPHFGGGGKNQTNLRKKESSLRINEWNEMVLWELREDCK